MLEWEEEATDMKSFDLYTAFMQFLTEFLKYILCVNMRQEQGT